MTILKSIEELEAIYGAPKETATVKELDRVSPEYRAYIEASPFVSLATVGPEGLDCSPRGDRPGFVRVEDERTLLMPDRAGNNRIDSLRNIVRDPRVALLFLIPGQVNSLRVNGRAKISADAELCESFAIEGRAPRSVIIVETESVYFQCGRALLRSGLWKPETWNETGKLPSAGQMLETVSEGSIDGKAYDDEWPGRAAKTLW